VCLPNLNFQLYSISDWLGPDSGWLAGAIGRNGIPIRTTSDLWMDKLKSSMIDSIRNLNEGNYLIYKISEVIE
jgi:hypothetical protein